MSSLIHTLETITLWKLVGFAGIGCFIMRWGIQIWFSKKLGVSTFPLFFWYFSISGSILLITYFSFGNPDLIGILANLCAFLIAVFNLYLRIRQPESESSNLSTVKTN